MSRPQPSGFPETDPDGCLEPVCLRLWAGIRFVVGSGLEAAGHLEDPGDGGEPRRPVDRVGFDV